MEKKEGKYEVELCPKRINDEIVTSEVENEILKENVKRMLPEKFIFSGEKDKNSVLHWEWVQKNPTGHDTVICEMGRGRCCAAVKDPHGGWMEVWYYTYRISI